MNKQQSFIINSTYTYNFHTYILTLTFKRQDFILNPLAGKSWKNKIYRVILNRKKNNNYNNGHLYTTYMLLDTILSSSQTFIKLSLLTTLHSIMFIFK